MKYSTIVEKDDKTLLEIIDALNQFEKERFIAGIQARHYTLFQYVPRRKNSKNAECYSHLPETFTLKDVMGVLDFEDNAARKQCQRWVKHGFVERIRNGRYKKVIQEIVV